MKTWVVAGIGVVIVLLLSTSVSAIGSTSMYPDNTGYLYIQKTAGDTWEYFHDASSGSIMSEPNTLLPQVYANNVEDEWRDFKRAYLIFNTSGIPGGEAAYSVNLSLYGYTKADSGGTIDFVLFSPSNPSSISANDYNNFGTESYLNYDISNVSYSRVNYTLDASIINEGGFTCIGILVNKDVMDDSTWGSYYEDRVGFRGQNAAVEYRPILYIDYASGMSVAGVVTGNLTQYSWNTASSNMVGCYGNSTFYKAIYYAGTSLTYWEDEENTTNQYTSDDIYFDEAGNFTFYVNVSCGGNYAEDSYNFTISEATYPTPIPTVTPAPGCVFFEVLVAGTNMSPISNATVSAYFSGDTTEIDTDSEGSAIFTVPYNTHVSGTVNKPGYQEAEFSWFVQTWDTWTVVTLYRDNETVPEVQEYSTLKLTFKNYVTGLVIDEGPIFISIYTDPGREDLWDSTITNSGMHTWLLLSGVPYYFKVSSGLYSTSYFTETISSYTDKIRYLVPVNPASDIDGDGIPDILDDDMDGDGIPNDEDTDIDGDGTPNDEDETPDGGTQQVLQPTIHIWAYSTTGYPISGALVTVTSETDSGSTTTGPNGTAYYFCDDLIQGQSRLYNISVHHGAYTDQNASVTVTTSNPSITFYMVPSTAVTPTPTAVYTTAPMPTWSGINGTPGNMQEFIYNWTIGQLGISFQASGMLLGLIICIVCACLVGGFSNSGMGAMIGGGFGWIAAGVMGYIPAWAIVVSVAVVILAFFVMRGSGTED